MLSGGTASGTVVSNASAEVVYGGGVASGTVVSAGGLEVVSAAGTATNTMVLSGGSVTDTGTLVGSATPDSLPAFTTKADLERAARELRAGS